MLNPKLLCKALLMYRRRDTLTLLSKNTVVKNAFLLEFTVGKLWTPILKAFDSLKQTFF